MDIERKVVVEPDNGTEAGWSSGPRTMANLPEFQEGEFENLVRHDADGDRQANMDAVVGRDEPHIIKRTSETVVVRISSLGRRDPRPPAAG
jgi:hypothetical protein